MSKAIIRVGYKEYVMDTADAVRLAEALSGTELYESNYHIDSKNYTHHIYPGEQEAISEIKIISDHHYRVAKAAGKPEK